MLPAATIEWLALKTGHRGGRYVDERGVHPHGVAGAACRRYRPDCCSEPRYAVGALKGGDGGDSYAVQAAIRFTCGR